MFSGRILIERRKNRRRGLFAQLHAPLIECVDVPEYALREHFVFIQSNQRAQPFRRECFEQYGALGRLPGCTLCGANI